MSTLSSGPVFRGHFYSFVAIVREPLQRLLSNIEFNLTFEGKARDIGNIHAKDILNYGVEWLLRSLPDANDRARAWIRNIMWTYLSLAPSLTPEIDAPKAIDAMSTVGLTEFFQESLLLTAFREGLMVPSVEPSLNRWSRRKEEVHIPDDLIEENLSYDYLIYEAARIRFNNDYAEMTEELSAFGDIKRSKIDSMDPSERNQLFATLINRRNIEARWEGNYKHIKPEINILGRAGISQLSFSQTGLLRDVTVLENISFLRHADWLVSGTRADYWINSGNRTSLEISVIYKIGQSPVVLHVESDLESISTADKAVIQIPRGRSHLSICAEGETLYDHHKAQGIHMPYDVPNVIAVITLS